MVFLIEYIVTWLSVDVSLLKVLPAVSFDLLAPCLHTEKLCSHTVLVISLPPESMWTMRWDRAMTGPVHVMDAGDPDLSLLPYPD